jgi:hypothetical protein
MREGVAPDGDFGCRLRFHLRSFSPSSLAADALIQLEDARRLKEAKCDSRGLSPFDAIYRRMRDRNSACAFLGRDSPIKFEKLPAGFDNTRDTLLHDFPAVQLFG